MPCAQQHELRQEVNRPDDEVLTISEDRLGDAPAGGRKSERKEIRRVI